MVVEAVHHLERPHGVDRVELHEIILGKAVHVIDVLIGCHDVLRPRAALMLGCAILYWRWRERAIGARRGTLRPPYPLQGICSRKMPQRDLANQWVAGNDV